MIQWHESFIQKSKTDFRMKRSINTSKILTKYSIKFEQRRSARKSNSYRILCLSQSLQNAQKFLVRSECQSRILRSIIAYNFHTDRYILFLKNACLRKPFSSIYREQFIRRFWTFASYLVGM